MKKTLMLMLLLAWGGLSWAQGNVSQTADFAVAYELDADAYTYCVVTGQGGDPWGQPRPGNGRIETSGSSTTITEVVTDQLPFADIVATDVLLINDGTSVYMRVVNGKTDGSEITVNTAIDLSNGATFQWMKTECGTAATSGWMGVSGFGDLTLIVQYDAGDLTGGLDVSWQCKSNGLNPQPLQIYPDSGDYNIATADVGKVDIARVAVVSYNAWNACRVGIKAGTSDSDGTVESVTITLVGR